MKQNQPSTLGMLTHYLLSIGPATLYAALRQRDLGFSADRRLLYHFALFARWGDLPSVATGIASPPRIYPLQAHLRGLVSLSRSEWRPMRP